MILQALKEYYDRKAVDPDSDIAPIGWEYKAIPFIVVLNSFGNLVQIEDTRESEGTKKKAKVFCVPRSENKTSNIKANLLWEKAEYIFAGIDAQKDEKRLQQEREAFSSRLENQLGEFKHIQVLLSFLKEVKSERLAQEACWGEIKEKNPYLTFRFHDEMTPLFLRPDILKKINEIKSNQLTGVANGNKTGVCLITGEPCVISRTHSKTFINRKNNSLVSFQKDSGYDSYGKKQGFNAPISKTSEFAYVTALNTLLKSPRQRFFIGDGTYVCWSADKTNFETEFAMIFDDPIAQDNPDLYSEKVKALLNSIKTGAFQADEGFQRFYVLGLSPGGGTRISVRFWDSRTISEYATNIQRYFDDLSIETFA